MGERIRWRCLLSLFALASVLLLAAACSSSQPASEPGPRALSQVPDLRAKTLTQVRELLDGQGVAVVVRFEAVEVTRTVEATRVAGALKPPRVARVALPLRVRTLARSTSVFATASHRVRAQAPGAGIPLSRVETITLTAGPHPGEGETPWLVGHALDDQAEGATGCFACHREMECNRCHVDLDHWYGR